MTNDEIDEACGWNTTAFHFFAISGSNFCFPTAENYKQLRAAFNGNGGGYLSRDYEDLRREYEDLRREYEDLRRPFTVTAADDYTDVWQFPTVNTYPGKHVCEKPLAMMLQIICASSRPHDTVLDCFCGSGVTGQAAVELGRKCILIDQDEHWYKQTIRRVQGLRPERPKVNGHRPLPLFDKPETTTTT